MAIQNVNIGIVIDINASADSNTVGASIAFQVDGDVEECTASYTDGDGKSRSTAGHRVDTDEDGDGNGTKSYFSFYAYGISQKEKCIELVAGQLSELASIGRY